MDCNGFNQSLLEAGKTQSLTSIHIYYEHIIYVHVVTKKAHLVCMKIYWLFLYLEKSTCVISKNNLNLITAMEKRIFIFIFRMNIGNNRPPSDRALFARNVNK